MTEGPTETTPPIVMALTFGGFVMLALSAAIWMGYIPVADQSVKPIVVAVVFIAGLIDFGMALYFKNRSRR
jgi:hypothetical protein